MKRQVLAASAIVLCSAAFGAVEGMAQQIFNQFRQPTLQVGRPYRDLDNCTQTRLSKNVLPATSFTLPPTNPVDVNDGYTRINFPADFRFTFNGQAFTGIYVSVNGFATFDNTKLVPAPNGAGLFTNSASYPDNVIAPFWGDHVYRTTADVAGGYMPSEISWVIDVDRDEDCDTIKYERVNPVSGATETYVRRCLIIQWKNLNVNNGAINSSVANFQARLYQATEEDNYQGDVEFAYGQVGGNPNTTNTTVVTRGATVGIKGNGGFPGYLSDFWNGLLYVPALGSNSRMDSTTTWQPSGGRSDAVIQFSAIVRFTFDMWGYGDADTSAARNQRHEGMAQNRRVTANDARVIMRSLVTRQYLDSVWKRQAYQGDVNHTGRFYYTTLNPDFTCCSTNVAINPVPPHTVIWRRTIDVDQFTGKQVRADLYEGDGLYGIGGRGPDVSNLSQIYYEVTELDAALIMRYIAGGLPYLPWVVTDTLGPVHGKVGTVAEASNVSFGTANVIGSDRVRVPVYLNGAHNGSFGVKFDADVNILDVVPVNGERTTVNVDNSNQVAVITGNGEFDATTPVAYVVFDRSNVIGITGIRFNEVVRGNATINTTDGTEQAAVSMAPNPMSTSTSINVTLPMSGMATVRVVDALGNAVATLFNGAVNAGDLSVSWDGRNANGNNVAAGTYIVRIDADGFRTSQMLTVLR